MAGKPKVRRTLGGRSRPRSSPRRGLVGAGLAVALAAAGCGGGARLSYAPPPDPPPIPLHKPPLPPGAMAALAVPPPPVISGKIGPEPAILAPTPRSRGSIPFAYIVQAGDTVYGISRKLGVPLREVIDANVLNPPYILSIAQILAIPNPRRHAVRRGDTVYGISRNYAVDMSELVRLNGIDSPYTITPGVQLVVPASLEPPASPAKLAANSGVVSEVPDKLAPPAKAAPGAVQKAAVTATARPVQAAKSARLAAIPTPPPRSSSKFLWPAKGKLIDSYGPKAGGLHNDGINIAAPRGTPVHAAENGVVVYSGNELRGFGNLILIKHADGWVTAYAHSDRTLVRRGEQVKRGQVIAKVGSSGNVSRPQLHFEIRKGAQAVDPRRLLGRKSAEKTTVAPA